MKGACDCPDGVPGRVVVDRGDTICVACGVVIDTHGFDERPEYFEPQHAIAGAPGSRQRTVAPSLDDRLLGATADLAPMRRRVSSQDPHKNVRMGFREVERFASSIGLSDSHTMVVTAKSIFRDYCEARKLRQDARAAAAACALYLGCKAHERSCDRNPRSLKEIEGVCGMDLHDMLKAFKSTLADKPYAHLLTSTVHASDVLTRAMGALVESGLSPDERRRALKRSRELHETVLRLDLMEGRNPHTVCSAVLYHALDGEAKGKVSKRDIQKACDVSGVTLNKALKELVQGIAAHDTRPEMQGSVRASQVSRAAGAGGAGGGPA
jgi:transcription initiation factor TFIIIB Brf1 subunit/transcription initiation factor TFIIB